jgi:hypothetical protein
MSYLRLSIRCWAAAKRSGLTSPPALPEAMRRVVAAEDGPAAALLAPAAVRAPPLRRWTALSVPISASLLLATVCSSPLSGGGTGWPVQLVSR